MNDTQKIIELIESLLDAGSILDAIEAQERQAKNLAQAECKEHLAMLDWRMRMRELEEKVRD